MTTHRPSTLWVHVTTLLNWSRPPVGIVRVEREYVRWLLDRLPGEPVRFCLFDRPSGRFVEVPLDTVREKLGLPAAMALPVTATALAAEPAASDKAAEASVGLDSPEGAAAEGPSEPGVEQAPAAPARQLPLWKRLIKQTLLTAVGVLPAAWRPVLIARLRFVQHVLIHAPRALREALEYKGARQVLEPGAVDPATQRPRSPFARGDRFISLGLDWDTLDQQVLYGLKRDLDLKLTLICYDVIPVLFPHLVVLPPGSFAAYFTDMAWCADSILCISEHTQRDCQSLLRKFGVPQPATHVIRLGSQVPAQGEGVQPPTLPMDRPFVLFVSTIERRKNHEILYRAWVRLREQGLTPYRLVFVGMQGWGVSDLYHDLHLDPRVKDDISILHHLSDEELAWMYRHCAFTVFPSLYEGWGLPVVESLACGKFCLASNASSLPEAGGDFAEYLDPWDLSAWVERLKFFMEHPQEVQARNARIAREFMPPQWHDTAARIHQLAWSDDVTSDQRQPLALTPESA